MKFRITYLLLFLSGMLIVGCCKEDNSRPEPGTIQFRASRVENVKSVIEDKDSFQEGNAFGVYGYYTPGTTSNSKHSDIFLNEKITYDGRTWFYENKKYWIPSMFYKFRAFFPYSDQDLFNSYKIENSFDPDQFTLRDFKVKRDVTQQEDLMYAETADLGPISQADQAPIGFSFKHLLANVNIIIKRAAKPTTQEDIIVYDSYKDFTLSNIRIRGMKSQGTYTHPVSGNPTIQSWDVAGITSDDIGYVRSFVGTEGLVDTQGLVVENDPERKNTAVWPNDACLLMVPQTFSPGQMMMDVNFMYTHITDQGDVRVSNKKSVQLPDASDWKIGKRIVYVAEITYDNEIRFSVIKVEPWAVTENSDMVIIR